MDSEEFRTRGREMVDYIADYLDTIRSRRPLPEVTPGYLRELIPSMAPDKGENFDAVMADLERVIMPGVTHWHSPQFHAYFPASNSFPAVLGDMLSNGLGGIGFTWASNPACTELEVVMMDWLGKMLQLPKHFLYSESDKGGGIIQSSASESALMALLCARSEVIRKLKADNPDITKGQVIDRLVAYTSEESHSCIERAALLSLVTVRVLPSDENGSLRGSTLEKAVEEDRANGLLPFYLGACIGTTTRCTFDNLVELGPVCHQYNMWLHIDAAYAGSACVCPELRYILDGIEHADSFAFNPHKWLQVNHDCTAMWVKDKHLMQNAFHIDYYILRHTNRAMPEFRHWQIPFGRSFRSLKLWFVMRSFGVSGLQATIRKDVSLAKHFENLVKGDPRFEIVAEVVLGLVCFRLKGDNSINQRLNQLVNQDGRIHMTPSKVKDLYFLRFAICATRTQEADVDFAWGIVRTMADKVTSMPNGVHKTDNNTVTCKANGVPTVADTATYRAKGVQTVADTATYRANGVQTVANTMTSKANGVQTVANTVPSKANGVHTVANTMTSRANGVHTMANTATTRANGVHTMTSRANGVYTMTSRANGVYTMPSRANGAHTMTSRANSVHTMTSRANGVHTMTSRANGVHTMTCKSNHAASKTNTVIIKVNGARPITDKVTCKVNGVPAMTDIMTIKSYGANKW